MLKFCPFTNKNFKVNERQQFINDIKGSEMEKYSEQTFATVLT